MKGRIHAAAKAGQTQEARLLEYKAREQDRELHNIFYRKLMDRYVGVLNELQLKLDEVTRLSITDPLTQVHNRLYFTEQLNRAIDLSRRHNHPLSLIMLDVDHFKRINDTFGHEAGDQALVKVCGVASKRIRTSDVFARWGGEEFVMLLPETDIAQAQLVAEDLRQQIQQADFPDNGRLTCSFGVAELKPDMNATAFCNAADMALYSAKQAGRNCVRAAPATP